MRGATACESSHAQSLPVSIWIRTGRHRRRTRRQLVGWDVDDELLRALARRRARSHAENDPAMHTATDESYEEPEGNDELMRPLDAAEREAVLDAVFARLDAGDAPGGEPVPVVPAV